MLKRLILFFLFITSWMSLSAQADCDNPILTHLFQNEHIRTRIGGGGSIWRQPYVIDPQPNDSLDIYPLYIGGLWIAGKDPEGNIKLASSKYGSFSVNSDYYPGPVVTGAQNYYCEKMEHFWPITQADIDAFLEDFQDGVLNEFHTNVMRWPAKGNPEFANIFGYNLPIQDLAPFVDQNGDGLYDPKQGDYPAMKGDQAVWWVFNDVGNIHAETGADPLGAEIQVMAYTFSGQSEAIDYSTFYDFKIINRSQTALDSFYTAIFFDNDLGCYTDDYIGCYPEEDLSFVYNEDAVDGTTGCFCDQGVNTYCEAIPLFGVKVLNSPADENGEPLGMSSFMYYNNQPPFPLPPSPVYDPDTPEQFYNLMQGQWTDGSPLIDMDDGYADVGDTTAYAFHDNPADPNGWSMCTVNLPPGDRRTVMGTGPAYLAPGEALEYSYVLLFVKDVPHPCPDITPLIEAGQEAQQIFDLNTSTEEINASQNQVVFSPNPMSKQARLALSEDSDLIEQVSLFNASGLKLRQYNSVFSSNLNIDRNNLPAGIYFYQLKTKNGAIFANKFIIR
jgi:hypothetical protein